VSVTVRPGAACEAIARVCRRAGLTGVREHFTREQGYHVVVASHRGGVYHAVPTTRGQIRVRWLPGGAGDDNVLALGTVDRPERVAGLILDHLHGLR
jgi:hypothetical protein